MKNRHFATHNALSSSIPFTANDDFIFPHGTVWISFVRLLVDGRLC